MNGRWPHVVQIALFVAGGIACVALGQVPIGAALVGAAIGNALPTSILPNAATTKDKEPPTP